MSDESSFLVRPTERQKANNATLLIGPALGCLTGGIALVQLQTIGSVDWSATYRLLYYCHNCKLAYKYNFQLNQTKIRNYTAGLV